MAQDFLSLKSVSRVVLGLLALDGVGGFSGNLILFGKGQCPHRCSRLRSTSTARRGVGNSVPDALRDVIVEQIEQHGGGRVKEVRETTPGPGLHNRHFKYTATEGIFFAKVSRGSLDNFAAEKMGLEAIRATGCLRAPRPIAQGLLPLGGSFLLMEYLPFIPFGQSIPVVLEKLAEGLAAMHLQEPPDDVKGFGFHADNFLGMSVQTNPWSKDFADFMVHSRLEPQFLRASRKFSTKYGTSNEDAIAFESLGSRIMEKAGKILEPVRHATPRLLHGDLWVGNFGGIPGEGKSRQAATFDPACWYGVHEFDLALATMFGGFGEPFYDVYHSIIPRAEGFEDRMRVYKLYHYLNHLNLHGAGFGHGGTVESPRGYFERCVGLMQDILADGSKG
ncbi:unnamed protein product [Discosporangium mesarthrocarpum]